MAMSSIYNYKAYQISEIVDRTSINLNFNATVKGAELETTWEPAPGLKFNFAGGYEDTRLANGSAGHRFDGSHRRQSRLDRGQAVRHAGVELHSSRHMSFARSRLYTDESFDTLRATTAYIRSCRSAYRCYLYGVSQRPPPVRIIRTFQQHQSPIPASIRCSVDPNAPANVNNGLGLPPNNGEGFDKNLSGNQLPNAPHFTTSLSAEYTMPVSEDWAATLHSDFYWQSQSFARVFNDRPYDKIRGYSTTNLALILTSAIGWQVMGYLKNVFNTTAITGDFLNSDDSGSDDQCVPDRSAPVRRPRHEELVRGNQ